MDKSKSSLINYRNLPRQGYDPETTREGRMYKVLSELSSDMAVDASRLIVSLEDVLHSLLWHMNHGDGPKGMDVSRVEVAEQLLATLKGKNDGPDLLPCPFCGSKAELVSEGLEYVVRCGGTSTCYGSAATGGRYGFEKKDDAVGLWNKRGKPDDERCEHCGAGDDNHHSFTCPTNLHPDRNPDKKGGSDA